MTTHCFEGSTLLASNATGSKRGFAGVVRGSLLAFDTGAQRTEVGPEPVATLRAYASPCRNASTRAAPQRLMAFRLRPGTVFFIRSSTVNGQRCASRLRERPAEVSSTLQCSTAQYCNLVWG